MSSGLWFLVTCVLVLQAVSCKHANSDVYEWNLYKEKYKKSYTNVIEEESRMKTFLDKLKKIEEHNKLYDEGKVTYKKAVNKFTDMPFDEFIKQMGGLNMAELKKHTPKNLNYFFLSKQNDTNETVPDAIDWRGKGAVTPVKDQLSCGSCWAFSASGALEGQLFKKTGDLVGLSEQNLVDCSRHEGNQGCNGGWMHWAFAYVKRNKGISKEFFYRYEGIDNFCRYISWFRGTSAHDYVMVPEGDEEELKNAVGTVGPVSVAFNVQEDFSHYSEGIYYEEICDPNDLSHGMLAVGYGTTEDGIDYWILKNSWGTDWGDKGYIKVARNRDNMCGIASVSSYPLV